MTTANLTHIQRVTDEQIAFGRKLGLDLRGCTVTVALAQIQVSIRKGFLGDCDGRFPTEKQVAFAKRHGFEIQDLDREIADAVVDDLMTELNMEAIDSERLAPGARVINVYDSLGGVKVISSIKEDGLVYFKGGQGSRAWARSLRRVPNDSESDTGICDQD